MFLKHSAGMVSADLESLNHCYRNDNSLSEVGSWSSQPPSPGEPDFPTPLPRPRTFVACPYVTDKKLQNPCSGKNVSVGTGSCVNTPPATPLPATLI